MDVQPFFEPVQVWFAFLYSVGIPVFKGDVLEFPVYAEEFVAEAQAHLRSCRRRAFAKLRRQRHQSFVELLARMGPAPNEGYIQGNNRERELTSSLNVQKLSPKTGNVSFIAIYLR